MKYYFFDISLFQEFEKERREEKRREKKLPPPPLFILNVFEKFRKSDVPEQFDTRPLCTLLIGIRI
jgi:hypothetical protein